MSQPLMTGQVASEHPILQARATGAASLEVSFEQLYNLYRRPVSAWLAPGVLVMNELNVERMLNDDWQAFVDARQPDPNLATIILKTPGGRITRTLLWAEIQEVLLAFAELQASIRDDPAASVLATTRWSVRQVVAHVASWAAEFRRQIETVARHETFDYLITFTPKVGPTEWNAREVERRRVQSIRESFEELATETERIQQLALTLSDAVLFGVAELPQTPDGLPEHRWRHRLADLMLMKCWHDRYHLGRLREVLGVSSD